MTSYEGAAEGRGNCLPKLSFRAIYLSLHAMILLVCTEEEFVGRREEGGVRQK